MMVAIVLGMMLLLYILISRSGDQTESGAQPVYVADNNAVSTTDSSSSDADAAKESADKAFDAGNYAEAASTYKAMRNGADSEVLNRLAWMYYNGKGVPQNYERAYSLYPKAGALGDADAQAMLGDLYGNGEGFPKDVLQAYIWSSVAAAQGNENGTSNRDIFAKLLTPDEVALGQSAATKCAATHYKRCGYKLPPKPSESDATNQPDPSKSGIY